MGKNAVIPHTRRKWRAFVWVPRPHEGMIFECLMSRQTWFNISGKNAEPGLEEQFLNFRLEWQSPDFECKTNRRG